MKQIFRISGSFLKQGVREKSGAFWLLIYPLILIIFYYLAFRGLEAGQVEPIPVGVSPRLPAIEILKQIPVLKTVVLAENQATAALDDESVLVYIDRDLNMNLRSSGIRQTIVRSIVEEIKQAQALGIRALRLDYSRDLIREQKLEPRPLAVIFYASFAMFSLYTFFSASISAALLQADQSFLAQRQSLSPIPKWRLLLGHLLGGFYLSAISSFLMLALSEGILGLSLIRNWPLSLLLLLSGNLCGLSLGLALGVTSLKENSKMAIGIAASIFLGMLSGMMNPEIGSSVRRNLPLLADLNPVNRISEGLYRINVIGTSGRLWPAIAVILGESALFFALAALSLRKKDYDSL